MTLGDISSKSSASTSAPADSSTPRCWAARQTRAGSPVGSAAATRRRRREEAGSFAIRRRKLASIRPAIGTDAGRVKPPASSAGVNPRGSSSKASGLPRASARMRSRTCSSNGSGRAERKRARASAWPRPSTGRHGRPFSSLGTVRAPNRNAMLFRPQATSHDGERLCRLSIKPLCVVDNAQDWVVGSELGQVGRGERDPRTIGRAASRQHVRTPHQEPRAEVLEALQACPSSVRRAAALRQKEAHSPLRSRQRGALETRLPNRLRSPTTWTYQFRVPRQSRSCRRDRTCRVQHPIEFVALVSPPEEHRRSPPLNRGRAGRVVRGSNAQPRHGREIS